MLQGIVRKWFVDKGFGFVEVKGHSVFCHMDRIVGQQWLRVGGDVWVKVVEDPSKGEGFWKAAEAWEASRWDREQARRKAQSAVDVATKASRIAFQSIEKTQRMMEKAEDAKLKMDVQPQNETQDVNPVLTKPPGLKNNKGKGKGSPPGIKGQGSQPVFRSLPPEMLDRKLPEEVQKTVDVFQGATLAVTGWKK